MTGIHTASEATMYTVGVVDDHELILDGMTGWIQAHATEMRVVIRASSWLDMARDPAFPPDLVIMDLQLRENVSVEARLRICRAAGTHVIVVSALDGPEIVQRVLGAGAAAFVSKSQPASELIETARRVLGVGTVHSGSRWDGEPRAMPVRPVLSTIRFTEEEEEILRLYASGHTPVEVAMIIGTNIQAVKNSLDRIRAQYESEGRVAEKKQDLALRAAEDGYLA